MTGGLTAFMRPTVDYSSLMWGAYLRISKGDDLVRFGIDTQKLQIRALMVAKGIPENRVVWFIDNDLSASPYATKVRPDWVSLRAKVESGELRGILCHSFDRFTRKMTENAAAVEWVNRTGVYWIDTEGSDPTSANGAMVIHIKGAVAEQESRRISERVRARFAANRSRGTYSSARRVFGYCAGPGGKGCDTRKPHPVEAKLVRLAFEWYIAGRETGEIMRAWRQQLPSTVPIGPKVVLRVLSNPVYAGLLRHNGSVIGAATNVHPIITEEMFRAAQEAQRQRTISKPYRYQGGKRKFIWGGIVRCECGAPLASEGFRWVCQKVRGGCAGVAITHTYLDAVMDDWMQQAITKSAPSAPVAAQGHAGVVEVLDDRARLEGVIARTRARIASGDIDEADGWDVIATARAALTDLIASEARHERDALLAARRAERESVDLLALWARRDEDSLTLRRALVLDYVSSIVITRSSTRGRLDPTRVRVNPTTS